MKDSNKPAVLMCVTPMAGHLEPLRVIAKELMSRGYEVTVLTGSFYRESIEKLGAAFVPLIGRADFSDQTLDEHFPMRRSLPEGPARVASEIKELFVAPIPFQHESIQNFLRRESARDPSRRIVLMADTGFLGALPSILGAPGLRPLGTITIGVCPLFLSHIKPPKSQKRSAPESLEERSERNDTMTKTMAKNMLVETQRLFLGILDELGANMISTPLSDAAVCLPDRYLQLSIPSAEYPCKDPPANLRWTGGLPRNGGKEWAWRPAWWDDVVINEKRKRVIAVAQGTLALCYEDLIIPTVLALQNRQDFLVIALLGKSGATLPTGISIPENTHVADFIPYDVLFPHCDVFVTNGGYGGFQQAIGNGIPVVVAGIGQDHREVAARAEWCGLGINLRTGKPNQGAVREAVDEVLFNSQYKKRALELQAEMKTFDPFAVIVENIEQVSRSSKL